MSKIKFLTFLCIVVLAAVGCSQITEVPKFFWGSSTKALEKGRAQAIQKTYHCPVAECFDAVVKLTIPPPIDDDAPLLPPGLSQSPSVTSTDLGFNSLGSATTSAAVDHLSLFIKNRKRNFLVVMGVPNCVNTTEVGIFFVPLDGGNVRVELSSLSTKAKRNASEMVFKELDKHFPEIE